MDWVSGEAELHLDGTFIESRVNYAFRFDAVVNHGNFTVIYEKLGTKGLVLNNGQVVREINRSFYQADVYEYPIAVFTNYRGQTILAHCPDEYNRIEFEDIQTGERLTHANGRNPSDFFHSRLRSNSDGSLLLSAGWVWHPYCDLAVFDTEAALSDASQLDHRKPSYELNYEILAAEFISPNSILLVTGDEQFDDEARETAVGPNALVVLDAPSGQVLSSVRVSEPIGLIMAIDEEIAVSFHTHPKLISLKTGEILKRWQEIDSGKQTCSIIWDGIRTAPIAVDHKRRRFAVAGKDIVWVVDIDDDESLAKHLN